MARTDTLGNFLTDVAESIRTKTGETGTILASEFDTKIKNIQGGGAAEDLSEELTTYDTELTTQETTIEDIVAALENKSVAGGGTIIQSKQLFNIDDFIQAGSTYTTDGYVMLCTSNRTSQYNAVYLSEVTDGTYNISLTTTKTSSLTSTKQGFWYVYRYDETAFYVVNLVEKQFYSLDVNNNLSIITEDGSFSEAVPIGTDMKIVVDGLVHNFYVDDTLVGTINNANTIGASTGKASYDGSSNFIMFTGLSKDSEV